MSSLSSFVAPLLCLVGPGTLSATVGYLAKISIDARSDFTSKFGVRMILNKICLLLWKV